MAKLSDVKARVRKNKQWAFLAEMLGETELKGVTAGVNHQGILLVNPEAAGRESTANLVDRVREEFKLAQELREVNGFR